MINSLDSDTFSARKAGSELGMLRDPQHCSSGGKLEETGKRQEANIRGGEKSVHVVFKYPS